MVYSSLPFQAVPAELIVIPRAFAHNFATAIHHILDHPLHSQMKKLFSRSYFMLDADKTLQKVYNSCSYPCQASQNILKEVQHRNKANCCRITPQCGCDGRINTEDTCAEGQSDKLHVNMSNSEPNQRNT